MNAVVSMGRRYPKSNCSGPKSYNRSRALIRPETSPCLVVIEVQPGTSVLQSAYEVSTCTNTSAAAGVKQFSAF
jgi:hypothetical protein